MEVYITLKNRIKKIRILFIIAIIFINTAGCAGRKNISSVDNQSDISEIVVENTMNKGNEADLGSGEQMQNASGKNTDNNKGMDSYMDSNNESNTEDTVKNKGPLYSEYCQELVDEIKANGYSKKTDSCFLTPVLLNPDDNSVFLMWFTEGQTKDNFVNILCSNEASFHEYSEIESSVEDYSGETARALEIERRIEAKSFKLSRVRGGKTKEDCNNPKIDANIYKHIAYIDKLPEYHGYVSERVSYYIESDGKKSEVYSLSSKAQKGTDVKVLFTSDLQIKPMCAANYQKVYETIGPVDAIFCDGDLVDVIDRAYDWFYADNAFFRVLTGTASDNINKCEYYGAPLLQQAPIYTSIGNHDVMGVLDDSLDLSQQFNNPQNREGGFNTITYEEIFDFPKYYSTSFGDIGLISLDVSRVWRLPTVGIMGKYSEHPRAKISQYGGGDFIFEPVSEGSPQIEFYKKELTDEKFKDSKYKITMFHAEAHSLGDNALPAFTDPVASEYYDSTTGLTTVLYDYPIEKDYIRTVIEPLAEENGVDLIFNAHSHLWNRFVTDKGMNVFQTSNVGNSYGGYLDGKGRSSIPSAFNKGDNWAKVADKYNSKNYPKYGDPAGLTPVAPNITDVPGNTPYVSSNNLTVFSVMDTGTGMMNSYYFDTEVPDSEVVLFDSFKVSNR